MDEHLPQCKARMMTSSSLVFFYQRRINKCNNSLPKLFPPIVFLLREECRLTFWMINKVFQSIFEMWWFGQSEISTIQIKMIKVRTGATTNPHCDCVAHLYGHIPFSWGPSKMHKPFIFACLRYDHWIRFKFKKHVIKIVSFKWIQPSQPHCNWHKWGRHKVGSTYHLFDRSNPFWWSRWVSNKAWERWLEGRFTISCLIDPFKS